MEVMPVSETRPRAAVSQDRERVPQTKAKSGSRIQFLVGKPIGHEGGQPGKTFEEGTGMKAGNVTLLFAKRADNSSPFLADVGCRF